MSGLFLLHLVLTALWLVLTESYTGPNFLFGFFIAYVVVVLFAHATGDRHYTSMAFRLVRFAGYFVFILIKANLQVAREVITPGHGMTPRVIAYDVRDLTDVQTVTLSNAITLTPGTLTADVSDDGATLYVHCMYAQDRAGAVAEIDRLKRNLIEGVFAK